MQREMHSYIHDYNGPERDHASLILMDIGNNECYIYSKQKYQKKEFYLSYVLVVAAAAFNWVHFFFSLSFWKQHVDYIKNVKIFYLADVGWSHLNWKLVFETCSTVKNAFIWKKKFQIEKQNTTIHNRPWLTNIRWEYQFQYGEIVVFTQKSAFHFP